MSHPDAETLALIGLGEPTSPAHAAHIAECAECRQEVEEFGRVAAIGRQSAEIRLVPPPPAVWERIAAETGVGGSAGSARSSEGSELTSTGSAPNGTGRPDLRIVHDEVPRDLAPRPHMRWIPLLAAACVGAIIGGTAVAATTQPTDQPQPAVVAQMALKPLVPDVSEARAELVKSDGQMRVQVDARGLPKREKGFYEVWLLDPSAKKLVALGSLDSGETGTFSIPVSMSDFPIVDVSFEPADGNPAHSGASVLRGGATA